MPGATFFPDAKINFAADLLRRSDDRDALVFRGEDKRKDRLSFAQLSALVSRLQQALKALGVGVGDRVAGMMPNMPETVAAMLATTSIGAVWSSCSPDFGERGVLDRFGQIEPKVLFTVDGYWYNSKMQRIGDKLRPIVDQTSIAQGDSDHSLSRRSRGGRQNAAACHDARSPAQVVCAQAGDVRAACVQSSRLHHVFIRHDRRAEMHRARRGRDAPATSQGAAAAMRSARRRSAVLFYHLRLDDVELARVGHRVRGEL